MRTLKKSLALVLALVMVLGLGVIGASADNALDNYTDASEIGDAYYEAVGVLTGLGIIDGMTETTIEPTGTYTREQAAKIIATMVLGVKNAESLTCVEAPFDDVPADRWSAGYIAFCVEQGIIDGMTDTTFEPTGTLTGFQWAKMLLAAVGFGANGEFTGTSWSLNTARVAHEAGLFTGDLSGADHVNLSRQQAALYAFNTLTEIKQVTYTSNANNYVYGIGGYWFADGTGHTLGESVYDLYSAEGIVYNDEGNSAKTTIIKDGYYSHATTLAEVNADLDAFMLDHGVRVWYTGSDATYGRNGFIRTPGKGDAVFVYDLSVVTVLECTLNYDKAYKAHYKGVDTDEIESVLTVGDGVDFYEVHFIDNSALSIADDIKDYVTVNYKFNKGELGARNESKDTVKVNTTVVKNSDVWTNISELGNGDDIVYLKANDEYYIYPVTATSGNVESLDKNGVITLTDGTELAPSVLKNDVSDMLDYIEWVLDSDLHSTPAMSFALDTHGHYIDMDYESFKTVGYYTGAYKPETLEGVWSSDIEWIAQFVDILTGDEELIPVTTAWKNANDNGKGDYYDITDMLYGDTVYAPHKIFDGTTAYGDIRFFDKVKFEKDMIETTGDSKVRFDMSDITFIVAYGQGEKLDSNTYEGLDALLDEMSNGYPVDYATLTNIAVSVEKSAYGNEYAVTVFAYEDAIVTGGYAFFAKDVTKWDSVTDSYKIYNAAYLNGSDEAATSFKIDKDSDVKLPITAGFYTYDINGRTGYASNLKKVDMLTVADSSKFDASGSTVWLNNVEVASDVVIADVREDPDDEIDTIDELADITGDFFDGTVKLVYFLNSDGKVAVIYIVDDNSSAWMFDVTAEMASTYTGTVTVSVSKELVDPSDADKTVTVTLSKPEGEAWAVNSQVVEYTVNGVKHSTELVAVGTNPITFTVIVSSDTAIVINDVHGA